MKKTPPIHDSRIEFQKCPLWLAFVSLLAFIPALPLFAQQGVLRDVEVFVPDSPIILRNADSISPKLPAPFQAILQLENRLNNIRDPDEALSYYKDLPKDQSEEMRKTIIENSKAKNPVPDPLEVFWSFVSFRDDLGDAAFVQMTAFIDVKTGNLNPATVDDPEKQPVEQQPDAKGLVTPPQYGYFFYFYRKASDQKWYKEMSPLADDFNEIIAGRRSELNAAIQRLNARRQLPHPDPIVGSWAWIWSGIIKETGAKQTGIGVLKADEKGDVTFEGTFSENGKPPVHSWKNGRWFHNTGSPNPKNYSVQWLEDVDTVTIDGDDIAGKSRNNFQIKGSKE
jgi:hypothetical protein